MKQVGQIILKSLIGLILTALVVGIGYGVKHYFTSEPLLAQHTKLIDTINTRIDSTQPAQIQQQINNLKVDLNELKKEVKENEKDRKEDHKDIMRYIINIYQQTNNNPQ